MNTDHNDEAETDVPSESAIPPFYLPFDSDELEADRAAAFGLPLRGRDTLVLLLLTLLADFCLYREWGGAGGAVMILVSTVVLMALKGQMAPVKLVVATVALSVALTWNAWWLAVVLSVVAAVRLAVSLWRPELNLLESLWAGCLSLGRAVHRLTGHVLSIRAASKASGGKQFPAKIIVIPILVTVLFLFVFTSANPVLARELSKLGEYFSSFGTLLGNCLNIGRSIFWLGWLMLFAALIRPVVSSEFIESLLNLDSRLVSRDMTSRDDVNFRAASVTLWCVNLLFLAYNCLDAVYLYFKATLPEGITWTAYTHAGCGWLTFGLFLSSLTLGFIFWNELNFHPRSHRLKQLAYIWIAQNAVLGVGTLRRIYMYIDYSGLTHLLLTGVYGSILVLAGLLIMAMKVHGNRSAIWLLRRYVAAFSTSLLILALTPHGWVCANFNVPRVMQDKPHAA